MKKLIVLAAMLALTACGTVRGFGDDVQTLGTWIEDGATKKPVSE